MDDGGPIDSMGPFWAYTAGDTWNGWITAEFTRDVAERVVEWVQAWSKAFPMDPTTLVWDGDTIVELDANWPDEPYRIEPYYNEDVGEVLYCIGTHGWCWEEA